MAENVIREDLDAKFSGASLVSIPTPDLEDLLARAARRRHPITFAIRAELLRRRSLMRGHQLYRRRRVRQRIA